MNIQPEDFEWRETDSQSARAMIARLTDRERLTGSFDVRRRDEDRLNTIHSDDVNLPYTATVGRGDGGKITIILDPSALVAEGEAKLSAFYGTRHVGSI
ncbi:MAG: hypothetical protein Q8M31_17100 [Beijerinckiaceae bacterium]|nr:hypothetical protein [Beijerinckiaceae bacterium]